MQSLVETGSVVLRKEVKNVGVYNRKDRRTEGRRTKAHFSFQLWLVNKQNNNKKKAHGWC